MQNFTNFTIAPPPDVNVQLRACKATTFKVHDDFFRITDFHQWINSETRDDLIRIRLQNSRTHFFKGWKIIIPNRTE